ncbi:MAG TPA: Sec-independent protein translocase protein TatB [Actinomycetota bacterium]|nr:Sec-independent protein translocase protein TatB [Actinomycetota bacterium]
MGRVGWSEIMIIMVIALVVFGPQRLPEVARQIGKAIREVRRVSGQFQDEVRTTFALDDEADPNFPYMRPPPDRSQSGPAVAPTLPTIADLDAPRDEPSDGADPPA